MRIKDSTIETLRGLACLLIVGYHAIPSIDASYGFVSYAYLGHCFRLIRLPLFTAISGYVYAMHPVGLGHFQSFIFSKARRILLPWVSVTILTVALKNALQSDGNFWVIRILHALWIPVDHLWFLPALFWVVLTVALLEISGLLRSVRCWLLVCAFAWMPAIFVLAIPDLAISGFFQLLPFFLLGLGLYRFSEQIYQPWVLILFFAIAITGLAIHQLMWFGILHLSEIQYNLLVLLTVYGTQGVIFKYRPSVRSLAIIGRYSFSIYLFHLIAISIATRFGKMTGIENIHWTFFIKLTVGLFLPIVTALILQRSVWLNFLFYGSRMQRSAQKGV